MFPMCNWLISRLPDRKDGSLQRALRRVAVTLLLVGAPASLSRLHGQAAQARPKVSPSVPKYQPVATVTGLVDLPGADDLADLGNEWNHGFQAFHADSGINYQGKVSREVVKDLLEGTTPVGIADREFTPEESKAFQTRFGYLPVRIPICMDANIVFVHKDNPLTSITMEQLDAIYSRTRLGGAKAPLVHWSDLGVKGDLGKREINAYSRQEGTASRASFARQALLNGQYRPGILDKEDSAQVGEALLTDPAGIAYGSLNAWYTANKVLPVMPFQGKDARFPNQENITTSKYPMPRLYYIYLNRVPGQPLDPRLNEVLHFLLSSEGQNQVADVGFMPGPVEFLAIALKRLDR